MASGGLGAVRDTLSSVFGGKKESRKPDTNATGTSYFSGGWTTVGEHGPELVNLPGGSKIYSNQTSGQMVSGSRSVNVHIDHMEVRSEEDIDRVAEKLAKKIEEAEDNM